MNIKQITQTRTISAFPISIGTSLVLESMYHGRLEPYDSERVVPRIDVSVWKHHMWSLRTLIRNYIGAIESTYYMDLVNNPEEVAIDLESEIKLLQEIYAIEGSNIITPIIYWNKHTDILVKPNHPLLHVRPFSKRAFALEMLAGRIYKILKDRNQIEIKTYNTLPTLPDGKVLITTHAIVDLLSSISGRRLGLMESHTGILKTRELWHTKLFGYSKDTQHLYSRLPLTREVLYLMGDKWVIKPHNKKFRDDLLNIAARRKFGPGTSSDRVKYWLFKDMGVKL